MRLLFVHPDLGVGGAERLVVDAALAAKQCDHDVTVLTNHYDETHCFEDTKNLYIITSFSWIPRQIAGRFHAFFAYLKMLLATIWLVYFSKLSFDVVICDQVSLPVAVFKLNKIKVIFYCHFPDQLLCVYDKRRNLLKRLYRAPLDWLEMTTTGMADIVLVNSKFTKQVFHNTFTSLSHKSIEVLYPSLNTTVFDNLLEHLPNEVDEKNPENKLELEKSHNKKFVFLSINRFERKKDLRLAIEAFAMARNKMEKNADTIHLIMAGGYDNRVEENVEHFKELKNLVKSMGLVDHVSFLRSISDSQKIRLLKHSFCLLYTPTNEHFGIVPIEAMYCEKPVIATNTGGPLETVVNDETGYLVKPDKEDFADAMLNLVSNPNKQAHLGSMARKRVIENFSFLAFQKKLNAILHKLYDPKNGSKKEE